MRCVGRTLFILTVFAIHFPDWAAASTVYGISANSPYSIYAYDTITDEYTFVGNAAFASYALGTQPGTGNLYFTSNSSPYRVGYFDTETQITTIINSDVGFAISPRMEFSLDGRLFGTRLNTNDLYEIDPVTGSVTYFGTLTGADFTANSGDIDFYTVNDFYIISSGNLYTVNLNDLEANFIGDCGVSLTGLAYTFEGDLYGSSLGFWFFPGSLYLINQLDASLTLLNNPPVTFYDLGNVIFFGDPEPEISITKSVSPATVSSGGVTEYSITISNTGNGPADISGIIDYLPLPFTYIPGSSSGSQIQDPVIEGNELIWDEDFTLDADTETTLSFQANVGLQRGSYFNNVSVYGSNFDIISTGETAAVQVISPVLSLTKVVDQSQAAPGDTILYSIHYLNSGDDFSSFVMIHETIPENTTYVTNSAEGNLMTIQFSHDGGFNYDSSQTPPITNIQFQRGTSLPAGSGETVTFKVRLD